MPEKPASERTEEATPERFRKAREEGQIPNSQEVPSALMVLTLLVTLAMCGAGLYRWLVGQIRGAVTVRPFGAIGSGGLTGMLHDSAASALTAMMPFLAAAAAASVFASLLSSGWAVSPKAVRLNFERVSPVRGLKNLLSTRSLVTLLISLAKLAVLVGIVWHFLAEKLPACYRLRWSTAEGTVLGICNLVFSLTARITVGLIVIAAVDLLYQRRKHKRDLRMTKQEVKEERKQYELSPEVRGRIRRTQLEMVRKRMLQEVPTADVVLVNPTHVAVALRYDAQKMVAPQLVAKGGDYLCEKIKEIARAHNVPIVHRPELARSIFAAVEIGQPIPEILFVAVAEVLAMIYRLGKRRLGR